ncbi:MAG TPA: HAD family hydrolase [Streptosporangiaceae bacterium]|nr:HAD family hydrolase [Streptosporangiaceae bacterium]
MTKPLVSIDVGGTLGHAEGPSLAEILGRQSPLGAAEARRIMRQMLHTQPSLSPAIVADLCAALRIPESAFPPAIQAQPLKLVPGAVTALRAMSQHATVVTLSNVTCAEADTDRLRQLLGPWVTDHFPSCRIGHAKPDPDAFRFVASACHASIEDMIHIGDDWACDVIGARAAGVTAIWLSRRRPAPDPNCSTTTACSWPAISPKPASTSPT